MFVRLDIYNNKFLFDDSNDKMLNVDSGGKYYLAIKEKKIKK